MDRFFFVAGSISAFLAVALGAFAAHGLKTKLSPEMFNIFEVGVRFGYGRQPLRSTSAWARRR